MNDEFVRLIAERTASIIGLPYIPEFIGWSKRRSFAKRRYHNKTNVFRIATWSNNENMYYRVSTIVHEVCHFVDFNGGHSPMFHDAEKKALEAWGMIPVYVDGECYRQALVSISNNETLWSRATANTKLASTRLRYGEGR